MSLVVEVRIPWQKRIWSWQVVAIAGPLLYGLGATAMYGDDYKLAIGLYFFGILLLVAKFISWEETRRENRRRRVALNVLAIIAAIAALWGSIKWVELRKADVSRNTSKPNLALETNQRQATLVTRPESSSTALPIPRKHQPKPAQKPPALPAPTVIAPGGIAIGRDNLGTAIVNNPPVNPYAPVVTYNFDGSKRVTQSGRTISMSVGDEEAGAYRRFVDLEKQESWTELRKQCEAQIEKNPDWPTAYYYSAVASEKLGRREEAINRLKQVEAMPAAADPQYAIALELLKKLRGR